MDRIRLIVENSFQQLKILALPAVFILESSNDSKENQNYYAYMKNSQVHETRNKDK